MFLGAKSLRPIRNDLKHDSTHPDKVEGTSTYLKFGSKTNFHAIKVFV